VTRAEGPQVFQALGRVDLETSVEQVLNRGGWGNPDVLLVATPNGHVVVKDFAPRSVWVRRGFGRWLLAREARSYQRLAGLPAVPRLLGAIDSDALVLEYRPGVLLSRSLAPKLAPDFMAELEASVVSMHRRGVVHLDLRHRSNILAGDDGHPVLLDFASAIRFDPKGLFGRLALAVLGWIDRRALQKWRLRLAQPASPVGVGAGSSAGSRGASRPM
jgi:serine/threonine protein kinase